MRSTQYFFLKKINKILEKIIKKITEKNIVKGLI